MAAIDEVLQLVSRRQPLTLLQQDIYLDWLKSQDNAASKIAELEAKAQAIDGIVGGILPIGVTKITKVSQISNDLGDMVAGRFIAPASTATSTEPTNAGFTGTAMSGNGETFGGVLYHIVGVNAGTLQFGLSAADGKAYFAGGDAVIDADGMTLSQGDISTPIADSSSVKWTNENDDITTYIQDAKADATSNSLIWSHRRLNAGGSVLAYSQLQAYSYDNGAASWAVLLNGRPYIHFSDSTSKFIIFNTDLNDIDFIINGDTDNSLFKADAGLDAIGIGGAADANYKLKVTGDFYASNVLSGTWTPTLTNTANLDGSTAYVGQYMRVGNTVTASVWVDVDPTTTSVQCTLGMSLPVASDFSSQIQCIGFASTYATAGAIELMSVSADITNNRVMIEWIANSVSNHGCLVMFTYQIV